MLSQYSIALVREATATYSLVPIVIYEVFANTPLPPANKDASSSLLLFIAASGVTRNGQAVKHHLATSNSRARHSECEMRNMLQPFYLPVRKTHVRFLLGILSCEVDQLRARVPFLTQLKQSRLFVDAIRGLQSQTVLCVESWPSVVIIESRLAPRLQPQSVSERVCVP